MKEKEILKQYIDVHNRMIDENGFTEKSLWGSKESQQLRFKILSDLILTKDNFDILDVGSGLCDFNSFLMLNGFENYNYSGLEINKAFVKVSKSKYPDIEIFEGTVNNLPIDRKWDYAVASGIFNLGISPEDTEEFFLNQFLHLYEQINIGFAVNFLSIYSSNKDKVSVYHNPIKVLDLCLKHFSKYVKLNQHYLPHDFTIFVYKKQVV